MLVFGFMTVSTPNDTFNIVVTVTVCVTICLQHKIQYMCEDMHPV